VNLVGIVILQRKNCGLSNCVTRYLVAMSAADLLVIIIDLILRHIPIAFYLEFRFLKLIPVCNIHAVLLYAATDCSVWFTVAFTFDRFVAICCPKLKNKYCSEKTAAVVLGTVSALSCLKNIFWYFILSSEYRLGNNPWFCYELFDLYTSVSWVTVECIHHFLTPFVPFVLILLLNILTVRHILVTNRARRRLRAHSSGEQSRDPELESRRKSIILLFILSANFILLWATLTYYTIWSRICELTSGLVYCLIVPGFVKQAGYMLQLVSCCTNTAIYAVTQTKFRKQFKNMVKYPFTSIHKFIKR